MKQLESILRSTQERLKEKQTELRNAERELNTKKEQLETTQQNLDQIKVNLQLCNSEFRSPLFETPTRYYKDRMYVVSVKTTVNMTVYKQSCASIGGKLAEIRSQGEYDVIKDYLTEHFNERYDYMHIGMTDKDNEGSWTYMSDDSPVTFKKWDPNDPTEPEDDCGLLIPHEFLMTDWDCNQSLTLRFLCEVPL